jgi:dsDNA-specific endonuclease/ATPase MutS2
MEQFNKLLEEYKGNYIQFLATGSAEYQRAYKKAQDFIEKALTQKRSVVEKEAEDMQHYTQSFKQDNSALSSMYDMGTDMYKDADQVQDQFEASKTRYDMINTIGDKGNKINVALGYAILWRVAIVILLIPVLVLLGYYWTQSSAVFAYGVQTPIAYGPRM